MQKNRGFTLIELMIVVAIIGILAAVAIPRFAQMLERSRESATKGNIGAIKSALSIYYGDWEGHWPGTLSTDAAYPFSRYLDVLPIVKVTAPNDVGYSPETLGDAVYYLTRGQVVAKLGYGWAYDSVMGNVFVNSTAIDSKEESYSTYGAPSYGQ